MTNSLPSMLQCNDNTDKYCTWRHDNFNRWCYDKEANNHEIRFKLFVLINQQFTTHMSVAGLER